MRFEASKKYPKVCGDFRHMEQGVLKRRGVSHLLGLRRGTVVEKARTATSVLIWLISSRTIPDFMATLAGVGLGVRSLGPCDLIGLGSLPLHLHGIFTH